MWSAGDGDDNRRFLADLRALRDAAALEFDELAARAHYPSDVLKEAESGPSLPTLPILAAYVRACDADVPEWEERWRRLGFEADADPGLPVRAAGTSPAAVAGARAGVGVAPPESYDAERIRAVLRGAHGSSDRGARGTARRTTAGTASGSLASGGVTSAGTVSGGTGWDTDTSADAVGGWGADTGFQRDAGGGTSWPGFQPDPNPNWDGAAAEVPAASSGWGSNGADVGGAPANGNHHVSEPADGLSETAVIETPDEARAEAIRRDPFSTAWLQDTELTSPPDLEPGWQDQADAEPAPDDWFAPRETTDPEQAWASADTQPSAAVADTWFTPREQADDELVPPEHDTAPPAEPEPLVTGFWTPSTAAQSAAAQSSAAAPGSTPAVASAAGPVTAAGPAAAAGLAAAEVRRPDLPQAEGLTIAERAVPPGPVVPPNAPRADRFYPVRLLVVIVVAALIGSILVLLLR
jgi:Helix-turn-helix domain